MKSKEQTRCNVVGLGENFGNHKWSHPEGGLYIWVEFDDQVDITDLHQNSVNDIDVGFIRTNYSPDGKDGNILLGYVMGLISRMK